MDSTPLSLPAAEAARRVATGRLAARDLAEALLERVAAREPVLRAFAHLDAARWRRQADAVDAAVRAGRAPGPLAGLAFGVKDVIDTADQPAQYGSPAWAGHRPRADAACVALARRAGAVIAGKTVTTEFATRFPGATTNPHNPAHTPGGSSSGSAAGVGAGVLHLAFGTQTAGSILRPAAYCGAVGYKPAFGTLHRAGMKVMSESLDTIGVIAREVSAVALAMSALTGMDHGDPDRALPAAPRLALVMGPGEAVLAPETVALFARAEAALAGRGAAVERRALPAALLHGFDLHAAVMNMESAEALAWELDTVRALLSPVLLEKMDGGRAEPRERLAEGRAAFAAARAAYAAWSEGVDAILTPAAPGEAPHGIGWTGDPSCNSLWTLLHAPAISVPAGTGPLGLPLGVQLVGRAGSEARLLAVAEWVRQALA